MDKTLENSTAFKQTPENFIKNVYSKARLILSSEQRIRIVMEALRKKNLWLPTAIIIEYWNPCFIN